MTDRLPERPPPPLGYNRVADYRTRAQEARERAMAATDDAVRNSLLRDAETWDRMADYEEKTSQW